VKDLKNIRRVVELTLLTTGTNVSALYRKYRTSRHKWFMTLGGTKVDDRLRIRLLRDALFQAMKLVIELQEILAREEVED